MDFGLKPTKVNGFEGSKTFDVPEFVSIESSGGGTNGVLEVCE
jgi:hypothetical protein